jgi:arylsulfatase
MLKPSRCGQSPAFAQRRKGQSALQRCVKRVLALVALLLSAAPAGADPQARPNIIVILSGDMGFSDIGCYGGEINTPNLDALAAGGLRFTQFYNTSRCCPTRASLLTGLYPHQAGVGHMMEDRGEKFPGYRGDLNRHCRTIPQVLEQAGYRSYAVGKWHVTRHIRQDGPKHNCPLQRGYARFYGMISGGGSFYDPWTLARDNKLISPYADPEYKSKTYYFTDAISDHAVQFVADHVKDLAAKHPDKVKTLARKWETWAKAAKVIPWVWKPAYRPISR